MPKQIKLIVANWKMNGNLLHNEQLLNNLKKSFINYQPACKIVVCVPTPYLAQVQSLCTNTKIHWGAQDISIHPKGAFTGEISVSMLQDFNVSYVIVGHSERRRYHHESTIEVIQKAQTALKSQITPIICIGETLKEYQANHTQAVLQKQITTIAKQLGREVNRSIIAYEPIWAIGTGKTATPKYVQNIHTMLRTQLKNINSEIDDVCILYGGSINASNAKQLLSQKDIDGGLIGSASLDSQQFLEIIKATDPLI
jgi:triosephosphate isomerase